MKKSVIQFSVILILLLVSFFTYNYLSNEAIKKHNIENPQHQLFSNKSIKY